MNVIRNFMQMADGKAWLSEETIEASLDPVFKIIKKKEINLPYYSLDQSRLINVTLTLTGGLCEDHINLENLNFSDDMSVQRTRIQNNLRKLFGITYDKWIVFTII